MSTVYRSTCAAFALVSLVFGVLLLASPGRFMSTFQWPVEPILTRMLGAALLALTWAAYQGWRTRNREIISLVIELGVIFSVLATLGVARHLLAANYPLIVWGALVMVGGFAILWLVTFFKK